MPSPLTTRKPPPLIRGRDALRLMTLLFALVFILWAMTKASKPQTWRWTEVFQQPAQQQKALDAGEPVSSDQPSLEVLTSASQAAGFVAQFAMPSSAPASYDLGMLGVFGQEFVPLPESKKATAGLKFQRIPTPVAEILRGARDRSGFLVEDPDDLDNPTYKPDADARYHLIELARDAGLDDLAAEARKDVRFAALMENPGDYRGQVIHVEGDLLWITTLELKRKVPGLDHVYQVIITVGGNDQPYYVLFTDLPPNLPPEKEWGSLYLRNVQFDGYFLKILRKDHPKEKGKGLLFPVLVGRSPRIPAQPGGLDFGLSVQTLIALVVGVIILGSIVVAWFRWNDRRYAIRLAAVRRRTKGEETDGMERGPDPGANGHYGK